MLGLGDTDASGDSYTYLNYPTGASTNSVANGTTGSTDWLNVLNTGLKAAAGIFTTRYAVPQLNPGQLIQGNGQTLYQAGAGASDVFPTLPSSFNSSWLLIGGAALLAVMVVSKR